MKMRVFGALLLGSILATSVLSLATDDIPLKPIRVHENSQPVPEAWSSREGSPGPDTIEISRTPLVNTDPNSPCRLVDTRAGSGFGGEYGPPSLSANVSRTFTVAGHCGIPVDAQAVAYRFTVVNMTSTGSLSAWPATGPPSTTPFLSWPATSVYAEYSMTLPLGPGGSLTVLENAPAGQTVDLVVDVDRDSLPVGTVRSLNNLFGFLTLTAGANLSITPSGSTLTIASPQTLTGITPGTGIAVSGGPPSPTVLIPPAGILQDRIASGQVVKSLNGLFDGVTLAGAGGATVSQSGQTITVTAPPGLPSGSANQTLRNNGAGWVTNSFLTNTGSAIGIGTPSPVQQLEITGNLRIPATTSTTGQIWIGNFPFIHILGTDNTFVGSAAGNLTLTGPHNTGVGNLALANDTSGQNNASLGTDTLMANTSGSGGTAVGAGALMGNTKGTFNTAVGYFSMANNTTANNNTAVGVGALYTQVYDNGGTPWDSDNTAIGYEALNKNAPTNSSEGIGNTAVGSKALHESATAHENTAVGASSLFNNTSGSENAALGNGSLQGNTTANRNTAVGSSALFTQSFDNGNVPWNSENTAVGYEALRSNQPTTAADGIQNCAFGVAALRDNATGIANTAVGHEALLLNIDGQNNVALGSGASYSNNHGSWNVAIGAVALVDNQSGTGNIAIGHTAGGGETGSNRLYIANGLGPLIYGQFDTKRVAINATDPTTTLDVNGSIRMRTVLASPLNYVCYNGSGVLGYCSSDASLKEDVRPLSADHDVAADLNRLRGVTFAWKDTNRAGEKRDIGVLAQDVEPVLPEVVSTHPDGHKSVDYPKLTAFLIEVAKAQQKEIESLKERLEALERSAPIR